jgi:hypothetical protein
MPITKRCSECDFPIRKHGKRTKDDKWGHKVIRGFRRVNTRIYKRFEWAKDKEKEWKDELSDN